MTARDSSHPVESLSAYLDGEVSAAEGARVEEHLGECGQCRALLEDLRLLSTATDAEEVPPVPEDLSRRIAWRLSHAGPVPAKRSWIFRVPLAAAASLAAAAVLWVVWQQGTAPLGEATLPEERAPRSMAETEPQATGEPAEALDELTPVLEAEEVPAREDLRKREAEPAAPEAGGSQRTADRDAGGKGKKGPAPEQAPSTSAEGKAPGRERATMVQRPADKPVAAAPEPDLEATAAADRGMVRVEKAAAPAAAQAEEGRGVMEENRQVVAEDLKARKPAAREDRLSLSAPSKDDAATSDEALAVPTLVLIEPGYEIRVARTGLLSVRTDTGYECAVNPYAAAVDVEAERLDPARADAAELEIAALFEDARAPTYRYAAVESDREEPETKDAPGWTLRMEGPRPVGALTAAPTATDSTPAAEPLAADLRDRLRFLVLQRHRELLESRCGPLPTVLLER
jgi:hypothetical protein